VRLGRAKLAEDALVFRIVATASFIDADSDQEKARRKRSAAL
jgi:hypothetical protein